VERNRCIHSALLRALRRQTSQRRWLRLHPTFGDIASESIRFRVKSATAARGAVSTENALPPPRLHRHSYTASCPAPNEPASVVLGLPPTVTGPRPRPDIAPGDKWRSSYPP